MLIVMKRLALLLCFCLAACATPEEIEARRQAQLQQDVDICRDYGFRPNSDAFRNCMLQLNIAREQRAQERTSYYYGYGTYPHRRPGAGVGYYLGY